MEHKSSARASFEDLEANHADPSSSRTSETGSALSQEEDELEEILPENHHRDQALLGATLRANVFNPDFLPSLRGEQGESSEDAEGDQQTDRFPVLLSASMRSNVFNSDFLSLVHERTEAQLQARGLDTQQSLALRVTSRAPGLFDDALGQVLDEELEKKRGIPEVPNSQERSTDSTAEEQGQAGQHGVTAASGNQPADLEGGNTDHGHRDSTGKGNKMSQQVENTKLSRPNSLKSAWQLVLQPHSAMAAQLEALVVVIILAGLLLCCLWLAIGRVASPNGAVFALVIVYFAAVFFGELAARVGTHPLVGMLVAGFICRYIPGVKAGHVLPSQLTAFIREFGLCTILLRAGIALDIKLLMRLKWLSCACSLIPTIVEATVLAGMSVWLLSLPWTWSYLAGFIVAGVAPAIVVPALLALQDGGYGVAKGIPSLVLAVAAVDDCLSVIGNAVFNSVIFSHSSITMSIFRAPIEIAMGTALGLGLGLGAVLLLPRSHPPGAVIDRDPSNRGHSRRHGGHHHRASGEHHRESHHHTSGESHHHHASGEHHHRHKASSPPEPVEVPKVAKSESDEDSGSVKVLKVLKDKIQPQKILPRVLPGDGPKMAILRTLYVLGFGLWTVLGGQKLKYSGAGALSVVVLGAVAGQGWGRELSSKPKLYLLYTWALLAQPLLFGVIGSQIDVSYFKGSFLWRGVIILPVAALARCLVTVGSTVGTVLNTRERLFLALAWLPKATVQASLAPQALSQVKSKHNPTLTGYAENVFALGMLSVILTAPLGAMILKILGPRLLQQTTDKPHQVVHAE